MSALKSRRAESWVVYRVGMKNGGEGPVAVCEHPDWAALEQSQPGVHTLLHAGIGTEAEADRIARGEPPPARAV
jgi:hypothetical protein